MFSRQYRLPYFITLQAVRQFHSSVFTVRYTQNNLQYNRYGFRIGKRVDRRAVVRNRTKRVLRSAVEALHPRLQPGFDFLFVVNRAVTQKNNRETREEVEQFFRKEHLFILDLIGNLYDNVS